ncbi:hypothetical protein AQUSIP_05870 [Aquicella siphonis]|uniref:TonB C-terminal domain-containing protein n=1 Tax=Aquicella siphonis TaxID=254247 RepID=A0A5E4PE97_9COXI|nr:cell envelope integrity protein TolA [Aquicella siphonis]VVC75299.1 hypothetical protein AQUSIP_05870 [Aquicella siphonis]
MAAPQESNKYFVFSTVFHIVILGVLVLSFERAATLPVFENTNKQDVISAVVLGDTDKSRILPRQLASRPVRQPVREKPDPAPKPQPVRQQVPAQVEKEVIALKKPEDKKKLKQQKALEALKKPDIFGKDLLADIKKQTDKQKLKEKKLQSQFQKTLREQAEQTLRQQIMNEDIRLKSAEMHLSQGEVNKYKALILQAISEHWIIPTQANKSLYCELMIRVAPGGAVLDVQVTKSSGDPSLDSSALAAVLKASPLPVPSESSAFEAFRQFVLKVKPENVLDGGLGVG